MADIPLNPLGETFCVCRYLTSIEDAPAFVCSGEMTHEDGLCDSCRTSTACTTHRILIAQGYTVLTPEVIGRLMAARRVAS